MMIWAQVHSETLLGVALSVLITIPVALYLSFYAGIIVTRCARFEDLRYELIRILQCLEWPPNTRGFQLMGGHRAFDVTLISSDLIALGHEDAANVVGRIGHDVSQELSRQNEWPTADEMQKRFVRWMRLARTMKPNRWPIINPRFRLFRKAKYDTSGD